MAVDSVRLTAVNAAELVDLRRHNVLKRTCEAWVKDDPGQRVPSEIGPERELTVSQFSRAVRSGQRCREIQMKTNIDFTFFGKIRGTLGIFHENHPADRGDSATNGALQDRICCPSIAPPVVRINDQPSVISFGGVAESRLK